MLPIDLPEGIDYFAIPWTQVADESWTQEKKVRVGQEVWIPCFPAQLEANEAGWPLLRHGTIATHPLSPVEKIPQMYVDYSHFGGDSGAPVLINDEGKVIVVGLVFAMSRQTDRSQTPFEERTTHTPLGLAIAIQSPPIRTIIQQACLEK